MTTRMSLFDAHGPAARTLAHLGWWLVLVSVLVVLVVSVLVLVACVRRRDHRESPTLVGPHRGELRWIYAGGLVVPAVILVLTLAFTLGALRAVGAPPRRPALTVQVIGHQWWWELRYVTGEPSRTVVTANELHVPVGEPVRLELTSADVIHSYWVPALNGKMDLNPGTRNVTWIEADTAGVYRGQCTEYCGTQHTNMATIVVADPPARFAEWLAAQAAPAAAPATDEARAGLAVVEGGPCAACHTVRGTGALGRMGPDLTHLASRATIAAGTLPNGPGYLAGWVANAQALKPGALMPTMTLSPRDLRAVLAYLQTLR